ncbi:MAG: FecR domain-containing protein [Leptospiraceae bacterium]|nr:FecR domain-containing protein [Leptospiraceae bacterium]MCP5511372.1 FecR domain-containing protein [Leptospiraceae bacterium]
MQKKDRSFFLIVLFSILTVFFSVLLFINMTRITEEGDNPVIGKLTFKRKTIERKFDLQVIWDDVESGVEIRNRDTIRTGDYSDAVLTLMDDTKISINENSMIYLDFSDSNTINFSYGSMSLINKGKGGSSNSESLKITTGDKVLEVGNSEIALEKKGKEELKLEVKEGKAKIISNGKEQVLNTNQVATLTQEEIQVKEVRLLPISPDDGSIHTGSSALVPIDFSWQTTGDIPKLRLEFSGDSRFSKLSRIIDVTGKTSAQIQMEPGRYYWRLASGTKKAKEYSGFQKIQVLSMIPPRFISPKNNQNFSYTNLPPLIEFFWNKNESFIEYKIEISGDSGFSNIIRKLSTINNHITIDKLEEGKYYARLSAITGNTEIEPVQSQSISFEIENKLVPDPPKLFQPENNQKINLFSIQKGLVDFSWKDSSEIVEYNIQVSGTKDFSNPVFSQKLSENYLKPTLNITPGLYYWRVQGISKNNKLSDYSKPFVFQIADQEKLETLLPANDSILTNDLPVTFKWKKINSYPNFLLEISKTKKFDSIFMTKKVNSYLEKIAIPEEGNYFWRLKLLSKTGEEIVSSDTNTFRIESFKDPELISPTNDEKLDMSKNDSIVFRWKEDPKAIYHIVKVYQLNPGKNKLITKPIKTKNSYFKLLDISKLDEGKFLWTVQSFFESAGKQIKSEEVQNKFTIYLSEKPEPPVIKTGKKVYVE